jgi:hypothetical protein
MTSWRCIGAIALLLATSDLHGGAKGKDVSLNQKDCALVFSSPVMSGSWELKNVGRKTIVSYTVACFQQERGKLKFARAFSDDVVRGPVKVGETSIVSGFDATEPNVCRWNTMLLGVYSIQFDDGSSWVSPISK